MQQKATRRLLSMCALGVCCSLYAGGCSVRIAQSLLTGFGFSLGAIPAEVVGGVIADAVTGGNDDQNP